MDAFNRLRGELYGHHFETQVVVGAHAPEPTPMTANGQHPGPVARIQLVDHRHGTAVRIRLMDSRSGRVIERSLEVEQGPEAASVLALRTVDLLRASLAELEMPRTPPVNRSLQKNSAVQLAPEPPNASPRVQLSPSLAVVYRGEGMGVGWGPLISVSVRTWPRWSLSGALVGPLIGGSQLFSQGSVSVRQGMAWLGARWTAFENRSVALYLALNLGGHWLTAEGQPLAPLIPQKGHVASALASGAVQATWILGRHLGVTISMHAATLAPHAGIALLEERATLPRPLLFGIAGLQVSP